MIKDLQIINVASHENSLFNFHPGINVIIGEGCHGKSTITRCLRILRYYRPNNFRFHSHFAKEKYSKIITNVIDNDEITNIELHKEKKDARYTIKYPNGKTEEFRKFKSTVPDAVINALNINDINFQYQFDSPFAISESPGRLTKIINDITKISQANQWIKKLNEFIRNNTNIYNDKKEELKETRKQLIKFKNLESIEKDIKKLNRIEKQISKLESESEEIEQLISDIEHSERKIKKLKSALKIETKYNRLKKISKQIEQEDDIIDEVESYIDSSNKISNLKTKLKKKIRTYIKQLKIEGKCPTCFSSINSESIKRIKDEIK